MSWYWHRKTAPLVTATVVLTALLHAANAAAELVNPIKLFNDHRESVVRIVTVNTAGQFRVGCGVVLLESGTIATAHELLKNTAGVRVETADGAIHDSATLLATDGVVALLKVNAQRLRPLKLADSSGFPGFTLAPPVIVVGGPADAGRMLAGGRVNAVLRTNATSSEPDRVLQIFIDAALFVENWGGPVFAEDGRAIGIVTPRGRSEPGDARHGVIPSNAVRDLLAKVSSAKNPGVSLPPLPAQPERLPARSAGEAIAAARSVSVSLVFAPDELKADLNKELARSFPWKTIDFDAHADVVLLVSATEETGARYWVIDGVRSATPAVQSRRYQVSVSLRDRGSHRELWSSRKSIDATASTPYQQVAARIVADMRESLATTAAPPPQSAVATAPAPVPASGTAASVLTAADLPQGFQSLSPEEIQKVGMTAEQQAASLRSWVEGANLVTHGVFVDPRKPQFVVVSTFKPVSPLSAAAFHLQAAYPEAMIQGMNEAENRTGAKRNPAVLLPGLDKFGDRSIGFSQTQTSGAATLREDIVFAIRGATLEVVHSVYPTGSQPTVAIGEILKIVDAKIAAER